MIAAIAVAAAAAAASTFAPPLDRPLVYRQTEERTIGDVTRRFAVTRTIVFHRDGDGYLADVATGPVAATSPDRVGALVASATTAFAGQVLRIHLDRRGVPTAIDALPAAWARYITAVTRLSPEIATRIAALPAPRQIALLASPVTQLIAPAVDAGTRAIAIPAGAAPSLAGQETVAIFGARARVTVDAEGDTARIERTREQDLVTGLLLSARERRIQRADRAAPVQSLAISTLTRVAR